MTHIMEDSLHARRSRFPPVAYRTCFIRRARVVRPDLNSSCRTWEDALWATISVLCEERQSKALARLGGGFWVPSERDSELGEAMWVSVRDGDEEEDVWQTDVELELQTLATMQVQLNDMRAWGFGHRGWPELIYISDLHTSIL